MSTYTLWPGKNRTSVLASLVKFLHQLRDDKPWRITIEPQAKERTSAQNRYLWGVAYAELAKASGHTPDDWHQFFCGEHYGWRERVLPGRRAESVPRRTTTKDEDGRASVMSAAEFCDFVLLVQSSAAAAGVFVPDPSPTGGDPRDE